MSFSQFEATARAAHAAAHVAGKAKKEPAFKNAGALYGGIGAHKNGASNLNTTLAVQRLAMK